MKANTYKFLVAILIISNIISGFIIVNYYNQLDEINLNYDKNLKELTKTNEMQEDEIRNKETEINQKSIQLEQAERSLSEGNSISATIELLIREKIVENSELISMLDTVDVGVLPHRFIEIENEYRIINKNFKLRFAPLYSSATSYILEDDFSTRVIDAIEIESVLYRETWIYVEVRNKSGYIEKGWIPLKNTTEYNNQTKYQIKNINIPKGITMYEAKLPEITDNLKIISEQNLECIIIRESGDFVLVNPFIPSEILTEMLYFVRKEDIIYWLDNKIHFIYY